MLALPRFGVIAVALVAISACVSIVPSTRVERSVRIATSGEINARSVDGSVASLTKAKQSGATVVDFSITSRGGDIESAMRLGRALKQARTTITVDEFCLSACAQYVLPAAQSIRIKPGAIVAIHQTPVGWLRARGRFMADDERRTVRALAAIADTYLRDLGADPDLLYCAERALAPDESVSPDGRVRTYAASTTLAIVDAEFLRRYTRRHVDDASASDPGGLVRRRATLGSAIALSGRERCTAEMRREDQALLAGSAETQSPDLILRVEP